LGKKKLRVTERQKSKEIRSAEVIIRGLKEGKKKELELGQPTVRWKVRRTGEEERQEEPLRMKRAELKKTKKSRPLTIEGESYQKGKVDSSREDGKTHVAAEEVNPLTGKFGRNGKNRPVIPVVALEEERVG